MGKAMASSDVPRLLCHRQWLVTSPPPWSRTHTHPKVSSSQEAPADGASPQQMPPPTKGIPPAGGDGSPIARAKAMTTSWQVVCSETPQTTLWIPSTQTFSSIPLATRPQAHWFIAGQAA